MLIPIDPRNGLRISYRQEGNWGADLNESTFDLHDLEALVVVDPPIPIPQQGRFLRDGVWHTADGVPAPEPAPVPEPPKRRRVAAGEPKLRKAKPKAKAV